MNFLNHQCRSAPSELTSFLESSASLEADRLKLAVCIDKVLKNKIDAKSKKKLLQLKEKINISVSYFGLLLYLSIFPNVIKWDEFDNELLYQIAVKALENNNRAYHEFQRYKDIVSYELCIYDEEPVNKLVNRNNTLEIIKAGAHYLSNQKYEKYLREEESKYGVGSKKFPLLNAIDKTEADLLRAMVFLPYAKKDFYTIEDLSREVNINWKINSKEKACRVLFKLLTEKEDVTFSVIPPELAIRMIYALNQERLELWRMFFAMFSASNFDMTSLNLKLTIDPSWRNKADDIPIKVSRQFNKVNFYITNGEEYIVNSPGISLDTVYVFSRRTGKLKTARLLLTKITGTMIFDYQYDYETNKLEIQSLWQKSFNECALLVSKMKEKHYQAKNYFSASSKEFKDQLSNILMQLKNDFKYNAKVYDRDEVKDSKIVKSPYNYEPIR